MADFRTPVVTRSRKNISRETLKIPESPSMNLLGVGTGVKVYSLLRSPCAGVRRSPWAIKKINRLVPTDTVEKRLIEEAGILKKLNHPNIIGFRDFVQTEDGNACLAMEACENSLTDLIELQNENGLGPFPAEIILKVGLDIAQGLDYLHRKCHLLHGDIKSFNILVKGNFEIAKICDFGVCLHLNAAGNLDPSHKGSEEGYIGTQCWTAPEVLENVDQLITTKADIFSYGIVLWEMISLEFPHISNCDETCNTSCIQSESSDNDVAEDSFNERLGTRPDLPNLPIEYDHVVHLFNWCTESDPNLRPHSKQVVVHLNGILANYVIFKGLSGQEEMNAITLCRSMLTS